MKGKKRLWKKALSLFLTVVMLMTCWVFFAPTKADAASAGSYVIKITYDIVDGNTLKNAYKGKGKDNNDSCGISVFYKDTNGTATTAKEELIDLHTDLSNNKGSAYGRTVTRTLSGFPYEIYAELTYGFKNTPFAAIDGMWERTVLVSGFSKAWAMTGWRLGYLCAPREIISQIYKIRQYGSMCAPTASQFAAIEALRNGDEDVEQMKAQYNRRRVLLLDGLRDLGVSCFEPQGAFSAFPHRALYCETSEQFCSRLLEQAGVAIVPGSAFGVGGEGCARISYAYSVSHIAQALERIAAFFERENKRG